MTSQLPSEGAGPKLRTSCDRCQLSKVRCSRGKPSCWRCSQSGVECVYSPLRKTGRPPKRSGGSPGSCSLRHQQRDASAARRASASSTTRSDSSRRGSVQRGRPPLPQEGGTRRHSYAAAHSLYRGNEPSVTGPAWHTGMDAMVSREPGTEHAALLSLPMMQMEGSFSSLGVADLVPDVNMWTMHSMPELDLHDAQTDAGLQSITETRSEASRFLGGAMLTPFATAAQDTQQTAGYYGLQASERGFFSSPLESSTSANWADDGAMSGTYFAVQTSATSSPSYTTTSHTSSVPISPGEVRRASPPRRSCAHDNATCHRALSDMLIKLGDLDPGTASGGSGSSSDGRRQTVLSLEALLGIERELRGRARAAMGCQRCVERPSAQNLVMVTAMALDSLLVLFERSRKEGEEQGGRAADRVVKRCDKVLALLAELDLLACSVMQGVNSVIYKHRSEDLYSRTCQLSHRFLRLGPGMPDGSLALLYE